MGVREQLEQTYFLELGRHLLADVRVENPEKLKDLEYIREVFYEAARKANLKVLNESFTVFENTGGISFLLFISESHISIHTWPEYSFASIDIYTCGENADPWKAYKYIARELHVIDGEVREIKRALKLKRN